LTQLVRQQPTKPEGLTLLVSLGANDAGPTDLDTMLTSLGRLWLLGFEPDWDTFYSSEKRRRVALPTYPFARKRYWIDPVTQGSHVMADQTVHREVVPHGRHASESAAVPGGDGMALLAITALQSVIQPPILQDTRQKTRRVIEKQLQLMTQQLEILRNRSVAGGLQK